MRKIPNRPGSRDRDGPALPRQVGTFLQTTRAHQLTGSYTDQAAEDMAAEDGKAELYTEMWGPHNREPRVIDAVNQTAETADSIISHAVETELSGRESELEDLEPEVGLAEDRVLDDLKAVETAGDDMASVRERCRGADLHVPEHHWRRMIAEGGGFTALGVGDLYFISTTFEVFGLSDSRLIGFIPVSQLQLVAFSVVMAMLLLTRLAGHLIRKVGYLIEEIKASEAQKDPNLPELARMLVRTKFKTGVAITAVLGAFGILYGLSEVRASYLKQEGINAHQGPFLLIQLGVACAGLVLAYWMSHPLDVDWRSATHHFRKAIAALKDDYAELSGIVGRFNGLLRERESLMVQFRDWTLATASDVRRLGHLIARRLQLALPEPVQEQILPDQLPVPPDPALAKAITDYLDGKPTYFKRYRPLTMDRVNERLEELDKRRNQQGVQSHDNLIEILSEARKRQPAMAGTSTNGNGKAPS